MEVELLRPSSLKNENESLSLFEKSFVYSRSCNSTQLTKYPPWHLWWLLNALSAGRVSLPGMQRTLTGGVHEILSTPGDGSGLR